MLLSCLVDICNNGVKEGRKRSELDWINESKQCYHGFIFLGNKKKFLPFHREVFTLATDFP